MKHIVFLICLVILVGQAFTQVKLAPLPSDNDSVCWWRFFLDSQVEKGRYSTIEENLESAVIAWDCDIFDCNYHVDSIITSYERDFPNTLNSALILCHRGEPCLNKSHLFVSIMNVRDFYPLASDEDIDLLVEKFKTRYDVVSIKNIGVKKIGSIATYPTKIELVYRTKK